MSGQQKLLDPGKAAPRPSKRREGDRYYTPADATAALLDLAPELQGQELLDPCCGDGRMARALADRFRLVQINDLDTRAIGIARAMFEEHHEGLVQYLTPRDAADPFLYLPAPDWVVTNPPFNAAGAIAQAALRHARRGVALLLRSTWLEPCGPSPRAPRGDRRWLTRLPPTRVIVLGRVSFTGGGSDSAGCIWAIWLREPGGPWQRGSIDVADPTPGQIGLNLEDP